MSSGRFWRISFHSESPDDKAAHFIAGGAPGVEITGPDSFDCYIEGGAPELDAALNEASRIGVACAGAAEVTEANWCAQCSELWEKTQAGALRIHPVQSDENSENFATESDILIIPGLGFGTGHHASTRQALVLMQRDVIKGQPPRTMLDVGTGSGILAIAAAKLFGAAVTAFDIDPHAVFSARDNCRINHKRNISLFTGELQAVGEQARFDLVTANLYAELLATLAENISGTVSGWLILSGIQCGLAGAVLQAYTKQGLIMNDRIEDSQWASFLFKAPGTR